jgi:ribonuclease Z
MNSRTWEKNGLKLEIPFSVPGVSTVMLLHHDERYTLIDCGDGAANYIHSLFGNGRTMYGSIGEILLTHEHMDHAGGIPSLLMLFEVAGREEPLNIVTPCGEKGTVGEMLSLIRSKLHFEVNLMNIMDGQHHGTYQTGKAEVISFRTRHRDSFPARRCGDPVQSFGYSIRYNGIKVVFSGDTGPTETLDRECTGADLAVLESTLEKQSDCEGLHLTVSEALEVGSLAHEKILIHPLRDDSGKMLI